MKPATGEKGLITPPKLREHGEKVSKKLRDFRVSVVKQTSSTWLAITCLAVVMVLYCWPLISRLTTAIPGTANDHDVATMVWNVGWVKHALENGSDLLHTDAVFAPLGADLRMHTYGLLQGLLAYPFTGILGVVGAYNLVLVATLFLNGLLAYALIQRETGHRLAALIAAVWLMLGTPLLFQLTVGRPAFGSLWIVAGELLVLGSLLDRPRLWKGLVLGLLLLAALFSDFQIVLFSGLWLMLYGLYRLGRDRLMILGWRQFAALLLGLVVFALPFLLIFYPALSEAGSDGYPRPQLTAMEPYSFVWWHFFAPDLMLNAYGYELFVTAIAAIVIFRGRGAYRFWLASALFFLVLALGPYLQPTDIQLPMAWLSLWPPLGQFRTPGRMAMPALLGLAMVAGFVLAGLLPRLPSRALLIGVTGVAIGARLLFALEHDPFLVQSYPDYQIYNQIAVEKGDFALLEVPFGMRSGLERIGQGGEILQYYQNIHGKKLLNGMVARVPATTFRAFRAHPALLLLANEPPKLDQNALDTDFDAVLNWSNVRYVLLHRSLLTGEQANTLTAFLNRQPRLTLLATENDLLIYRLGN